jgi:hypothetical protein
MVIISPRVLLISNERDASVDWVVRALRARGIPYLRINTERIERYGVTVDPATNLWHFSTAKVKYVLDEVKGVWFRRPECSAQVRDAPLTDAEKNFACGQLQALVLSLSVLGQNKWLNSPHLNLSAESKIRQLWHAKEFGFSVPDSIITNSRSEALKFTRRHSGDVVLKALHAPLITEAGASRFIFTQRLEKGHLEGMQAVEPVPFILQREIHPKIDVRVIVVDNESFSAAAEPHEFLDWRTGVSKVSFRPHTIPSQLTTQCVQFLRHLGLRFGAFDFALATDGTYYFLELNPNGEWGWLEKTCGLGISNAIAKALLNPSELGHQAHNE